MSDKTASPAASAADDLIEDFAFFDDWEDRYRHVIELGQALPALTPQEHNDATRVAGCASQVWLVVEPDPDAPTRIRVRGDSDAHIVKGLAAILARLYAGQEPAQVAAVDPEAVFARIGLVEHLSSQRANGLKSMIARIRRDAAALAAG